jgi:hypothetical protein
VAVSSADSVVPGAADGVAVTLLTVDVHEPGFVAGVNAENRHAFWFQHTAQAAPWGPANPQALNRYSYVLNNPVRWTDPTGHNPALAALGYVLAGAGITISAPVLAALAGAVALSLVIGCVADRGCRGWLSELLDMGIEGVKKFTTDVGHVLQAKKKDIDKKERSPHPIGGRYRYNTKKEAYEAAKRAGKGAEPVLHTDDEHGPHYHPGDSKGSHSIMITITFLKRDDEFIIHKSFLIDYY